MGVITKSNQYFCIDKLTIDKHTKTVYAEIKVYNAKEDRASKPPLTVFTHHANLTDSQWKDCFGTRLDGENPYKLAYDFLKTIDNAFTTGTDV
jgi:hypothetical protein